MQQDIMTIYRDLQAAVTDAKAKQDALTAKRAKLEAIRVKEQAAIDEAAQAYEDAIVAVNRLREQANGVIAEMFGTQESRFTVR